MATGLVLQSGNLNNYFNTQIEGILHSYTLDVLKDRKQQQQLEQELNQQIPIGNWSMQILGSTIRLNLTSFDRRNKLIWAY